MGILTDASAVDAVSDSDDADEQRYEKLLAGIGVDTTKEPKAPQGKRTEAASDVSVYSLSAVSTLGSKLPLHRLMKDVEKTVANNALVKQLNKIQKPAQVLHAPLPRPVADRLERKVEYDKAKKSLAKWDPVVQRNRRAEQLSFPLGHEPLRISSVDTMFAAQQKNLTPLEQELYALLQGNKCAERPDHDLTVAEEEALATLSLEEAQNRRAELQKHRALMSYHEAKSKRTKKIKSRGYHRIQRKRIAKAEKDADGADEETRLDQAQRLRAEERASLRHRMGSKWAKSRKLVAKHDDATRLDLEEQAVKHQELVRKPVDVTDEGDNENTIEDKELNTVGNLSATKIAMPVHFPADVSNNPWLSGSNKDQESEVDNVDNSKSCNKADDVASASDDENINTVQQPTAVLSPRESLRKWLSGEDGDGHARTVDSEPKSDPVAMDKFKAALTSLQKESNARSDVAVTANGDSDLHDDCVVDDAETDGLHEVAGTNDETAETDKRSRTAKQIKRTPSNSSSKVETDPNKCFEVPCKDIVGDKSVFVEDERGARGADHMTIAQAFADDDVIAEFSSLKRKTVDDDKPAVVDLSLPGWGEWGGTGIKPSKRKRKRFRRKPPTGPPRRDRALGHVIISETRDVHISKHQVSQIPFPYNNKEQFERTLARPVGSTWNTPSVVKELVKPKLTTVAGAIIAPMNAEEATSLQSKKSLKRARKKNSRKKEKELKLEKLKFY